MNKKSIIDFSQYEPIISEEYIIFKNKDEQIKTKVSIIGTYNKILLCWYWSWALDFINRNSIKKALLIKNYDKKKFSKPTQLNELYNFFISNNVFHLSKENKNTLCDLCSNILDLQCIFISKNNDFDDMICIEEIININSI